MKYFHINNQPNLVGAKYVETKRNVLNPLQGLSFVSISYYQLKNGEIIGIIF